MHGKVGQRIIIMQKNYIRWVSSLRVDLVESLHKRAIPNFEIISSDLFILELIYSIAELSTSQNHLRRVPFVAISDFCVVLYFDLDYCFCHIIFYSFFTSFYPNSSSILFCFRLSGSTTIKL